MAITSNRQYLEALKEEARMCKKWPMSKLEMRMLEKLQVEMHKYLLKLERKHNKEGD